MCDVYVLTDMKLDINLKYIFLINNNMLKINTTDKWKYTVCMEDRISLQP